MNLGSIQMGSGFSTLTLNEELSFVEYTPSNMSRFCEERLSALSLSGLENRCEPGAQT